ncbi:neurogenic locus notch homolog protein 1-like [Plakobranchus ocellatus]|uniref:Neurogenic locus notch homolog protein 1-like n=1 Tax=Plakobranchus ocellatus TaxID=259542 RepID=A0AAV3YQD9_9GAST|nr:neurogenic locus notch homolog protein 1-like [Plakobranchus ocellatus]
MRCFDLKGKKWPGTILKPDQMSIVLCKSSTESSWFYDATVNDDLHIGFVLFAAARFSGDGTVFFVVKFKSYRNKGGLQSNGDVCDGRWGVRVDACDHKFGLCVDYVDRYEKSIENCLYSGPVYTREYRNQDVINFNGQEMRFLYESWPGGVWLKIQVFDVDPKEDEDVDYLSRKFKALPTTGSNPSKRLLRLMGTRNTIGHYGPDCLKRCLPEIGDHYGCTSSGDKACHSGWAGLDCDINIDDCLGVLCKHGGSCQDLVNDYECACTEGYEGKHCQRNKNECLSRASCKHGTCFDEVGYYRCECYPGYSGKTCDIYTDVCDSKPCINGGTCENVRGDYICHCPDNFKGPNCIEDVDECLERNPCYNGSTCLNILGTFSCECPIGMKGRTCSEDVDECLHGTLCANGATCVNTLGSFSCRCALGFTASHAHAQMVTKDACVARILTSVSEYHARMVLYVRTLSAVSLVVARMVMRDLNVVPESLQRWHVASITKVCWTRNPLRCSEDNFHSQDEHDWSIVQPKAMPTSKFIQSVVYLSVENLILNPLNKSSSITGTLSGTWYILRTCWIILSGTEPFAVARFTSLSVGGLLVNLTPGVDGQTRPSISSSGFTRFGSEYILRMRLPVPLKCLILVAERAAW